jgi:hypothetical protein
LGHIIEQADRVNVTARDVIQAAYTYAHVNDDGMWVQPASKSEIVVSKNDAASAQESFRGSAAPLVRSAAKPVARRRAAKHIAAPQGPAKPPQELEAEVRAAYLQAAAPDPAGPFRGVAEPEKVQIRVIHNVPRPNRDPAPPESSILISTNEAHGINSK